MAATDEDDGEGDARRSQNNVSRAAQRDQIVIILVGRDENKECSGEPNQDEANTSEEVNENRRGFARGSRTTSSPYQICLIFASA
jgi:hypothetical protein